MFTLIRPLAAILLGVFTLYAAQAYEPLYDPDAYLGNFRFWAAGVGAVVGWLFLGGRIGQRLWMSMFVGVQAVAMTALGTAMVLAVREVFVLGYRRRYHEVMDAFTGYFDIIVNWLSKALVQDYLILLAAGGVAIGLVLHLLWWMLESRRNER
ncbi:MAG: TrgA family protein [Rhodobacter sp.]|nr:TrgA family protein [Paracoccaceae bacterium]MCC0075335.1 TrgA family protein [Rhodobacter sp.]